jgi:hypothetical protein
MITYIIGEGCYLHKGEANLPVCGHKNSIKLSQDNFFLIIWLCKFPITGVQLNETLSINPVIEAIS